MNFRTALYFIIMIVSFYFIQHWISPSPQQQIVKQEVVQEIKKEEPIFQKIEETFYVLENDLIQVVFSNAGGAVSEINFPLWSKENKQSIVKPVETDQKIQEDSPRNDYFPLHAYYTPAENNSGSYVNHEKGSLGGYHPLLRRPIQNGKSPLDYQYYLGSIQDEEITAYKVVRFEKNIIQFEATLPQKRIVKTYSFSDKAPYCINLDVKIDGSATNTWLYSGVVETELISGQPSPSMRFRTIRGTKSSVESVKLKNPMYDSSSYPDWLSSSNGFFGIIMDPLTDPKPGFRTQVIEGVNFPTRLTLIDQKYDKYPAKKYPGHAFLLPLKGNQTQSFRIFAGPLQVNLLKEIDTIFSNPLKGYNPEYSKAISFDRWFAFISEPFGKFLFFLLQFFNKITHSWGLSIILLTIALRLMLYPLNAWSIKSMSRMQDVGPKIKAVQERYKKDPKRSQIEVMKIYKEQGVNPMGGCLPMIIQLPFLIGMFDLIKSSFDLRGAAFIPGWINNLTSPDVIFSWKYPIFFIGTELHLLPLLLGLAMWLQPKFSAKMPKDKALLTDQQKQQRTMGNVMAIVFTFLFYNFPSGLNIYWLSSSVLGIIQQWYMTKKTKTQ